LSVAGCSGDWDDLILIMLLNNLFKKSYPRLDWIQVEVSSYCNADCIYCPHTAYRKNWQNRYLPMEVFERLIPAFAKTKLIYLQGWGEPFLHPDFFAMLQSAKQAGCLVGTTSNATILNDKTIERLVGEGLDVIGLSLAGIDEKNDVIRKGTSIKKTLACIETFQRVKSKHGTDNPRIHIAYMLLAGSLTDLERLPEFLANTGVNQTVISSLSLAVNPAMDDEARLVQVPEDSGQLRRRLLEVKDAAAKRGADIHFRLVAPQSADFRCSENVARAVVVGSDGSISPCVFTCMPVLGENFYYFKGQRQTQQNLSFGNIQTEDLNIIWHHQAYEEFARAHTRGRIPAICRNCYKGFVGELE
jgi:MoaA/NifB/PqqE/SkfB family radical SAM enzyme